MSADHCDHPVPRRLLDPRNAKPLWIVMAALVLALVAVILGPGMSTYRRHSAIAHVEKLGGKTHARSRRLAGLGPLSAAVPDSAFNVVTSVSLLDVRLGDSDLDCLRELPHIEALELSDTQATDRNLQSLSCLTKLELLNLQHTNISDPGLDHLKGLSKLRVLSLSYTEISDRGLARLKGLSGLRRLDLVATRVTDAGLEHLEGLPLLEQVNLRKTKVTAAGITELQRVLPTLKVHK